MKEKDLYITFSGLKDGSHDFPFQLKDSFFALFEYAEVEKGELTAKVVLNKKPNMLTLDFAISGEVELACDTCTEPYLQNISSNNSLIVKFSDIVEPEENDEILLLPTSEHQLYIGQYLYEFIHLALPTKRIHANEEDCNQEIIDKLNELAYQEPELSDPRWEVLKNLKK
jgi:uncharacterized protein